MNPRAKPHHARADRLKAGRTRPSDEVQPRLSAAFSLIECLVYIGLFALIVGFAYTVFYHGWDNSMGLRRHAEQLTKALRSGERWRADVRSATGAVHVEETPEGEVLHIPRGGDEVQYRFADRTVWRKAESDAIWVQVLEQIQSSRMEADGRKQVTAWRWELELRTREKTVRMRPVLTFEVVPAQQPLTR